MSPKKTIAAGGVAILALAGAAVAVPAQAAPLDQWDFRETRATGHYERTAEGLHIWTEGTASSDKVAGYLKVDLPLASTLSGGLDYTAAGGGVPGAQFVVDIDGNGTGDGILVGESVYGQNWWLTGGSSAAFKALDPSGAENGGNGSEWFGTLAQWAAAAPGAKIVSVGFSLGSGVKGEGVVRAVLAGDQRYTFDAARVAPVITNVLADGAVVGGKATFTVDLADDDISYTYIELNRGGKWLTDNTKSAGSTNHGLHPKLVVDLGAYPDGAYQLKINAVDTSGLSANRVVPFTIDNTRPTLELVSPANGASFAASAGVKLDVRAADAGKLTDVVVNVYRDGKLLKSLGKQSTAGAVGWTGSWNLPTGLADGTYTLKIGTTDLAGNNRTISSSIVIDSSLGEGDGEGETEEPAAAPSLSVDTTQVKVGSALKIAGANFAAGTSITLELHSDPVVLGTAVAGEDGSIAFDAVVPASIPTGDHEIVAFFGENGELRVPITVTAADATPTAGASSTAASAGTGSAAGLADTGFEGIGLGIGALVVLLGAGVLAITALRRRVADVRD
ncbi:hypothetical protein GE115_08105 [Agromyces sp. CFH 90414]|uniref:Ig-like domain repeat protein n=1 Tax=Agromyces agglutinans TaxID=2662258 RepID=A0A6I2F5F1_9MICO|nr:Ig-like domain-containing protein [Agromyces agglutinans]MRG59829.1 hypothetical protein [Agromyces agglutinans]